VEGCRWDLRCEVKYRIVWFGSAGLVGISSLGTGCGDAISVPSLLLHPGL
jgi:hypothetical protein